MINELNIELDRLRMNGKLILQIKKTELIFKGASALDRTLRV
jgi:hypothetical protein